MYRERTNLSGLNELFHSQYSCITAVMLQGTLKRRDYMLMAVTSLHLKPSVICIELKSFCSLTPTEHSWNLVFPRALLPSLLLTFTKIEIETHCTSDPSIITESQNGSYWK